MDENVGSFDCTRREDEEQGQGDHWRLRLWRDGSLLIHSQGWRRGEIKPAAMAYIPNLWEKITDILERNNDNSNKYTINKLCWCVHIIRACV